ncbi:hypothetical protein NS359_14700, partial [Curtobacterium oceanosedimentum]
MRQWRRLRWDDTVAPASLLAHLRRAPVSVTTAVAAVVLVVSARIAHAEPDFPHHPPVALLAL